MTVIGIDSHKDVLAGCLVDASGVAVEQRSIANTEAGHAELVAWAGAVDAQRVGIEGAGNYRRPADPQPRRSSTLGQRCWRCPRR